MQAFNVGALGIAIAGMLGSQASAAVVAATGSESCAAGSAGDHCRMKGDAMLQHKSSVVSRLLDAGGSAKSGAALTEVSSTSAWLSSLLAHTGSGVSPVQAAVAKDGRTATVRFRHADKTWDYKLAAFSVYAEDARVLAHTANGEEERSVPGRDGTSRRTFKARETDNAHGRWASAVVHPDGSVTGLFQLEDSVVRLESLGGKDTTQSSASLLEVDGQTATVHSMQRLNMSRLFAGEEPHTGGDDMTDGIDHIPHMRDDQSEEPIISGRAQWTGTKWWPGCYSGDSALNEFKVGVVADEDAFEEHGSQLQSMLETVFVETSFVYEHQFNLKLSIGYQKIYESPNGAPNYAKGCSPVLKLSDFKAKAAQDMPSGMGASHLFTGCGTGYGTIGVAWVGTICRRDGYATGVNQLHKTKDWLTFAHELGHNFDGAHSFEDGQGRTGGIMDYGDGLLDGAYQFNTKYRKTKMCAKMNQVVNNCQGGFAKASGTPTPRPSPSPPSPGPPSPPELQALKDRIQGMQEELEKTEDAIEKVEATLA